MSNQLNEDVVKIVDAIFTKKEESEMVKATEEALTKSADTINELSESLEAKDSELADKKSEILGLSETVETLENKITELEDEKKTFETEKSEFETEKAKIVKRAEDAESKIQEMEKDKLVETRLGELKEAGVAATNDKAVEDQTTKVREMSDEEFSSYRNELVAMREAIIAELKTSGNEDSTKTGDTETGEKGESEEDDETAAASAETAISAMHTVAAALNMEVAPNKDMVTKYQELGEQMAKNSKPKKSDE